MFALGVTLLVRRSAESRALASASGAQPA